MLERSMLLELFMLPELFMFAEPARFIEPDWLTVLGCVVDDVPGLSTGPLAEGVGVELLSVEALGLLDCAKAVPAVRRATAAT
jgi:hypothetical protein